MDALRPIPVAMCFDVEPEEREVAPVAGPWRGFEGLIDRIGSLRHELESLTSRQVRFNWFLRMDPQIAESHGNAGWVAERYWDQLQVLRSAGDGIGVHPHAWRWSARRNRWVTDHADAEWVDHCVRVSFEAFASAFGEPCRLVRFGDRFVSARALRTAAQLGARFDLTVEPGMPGARAVGGAHATGRIPSQARAPRAPYRPSASDPLKPTHSEAAGDDLGLWVIPLTAIDSNPLVPHWRRVARRVRHPRGPRYRTARLPPPWRAADFWAIVQRGLEASPRPHLAFATRTDAFASGSRPRRHFEEKMAALQQWPLARNLAFATPEALIAAARLESPAR